jgi:hypothetical protein
MNRAQHAYRIEPFLSRKGLSLAPTSAVCSGKLLKASLAMSAAAHRELVYENELDDQFTGLQVRQKP